MFDSNSAGQEQKNRDSAARYRALPLRSIERMEQEGNIALLDCGHRKALLVWLRAGDSVRCQECYDDGMRYAEQMLTGDGHDHDHRAP